MEIDCCSIFHHVVATNEQSVQVEMSGTFPPHGSCYINAHLPNYFYDHIKVSIMPTTFPLLEEMNHGFSHFQYYCMSNTRGDD